MQPLPSRHRRHSSSSAAHCGRCGATTAAPTARAHLRAQCRRHLLRGAVRTARPSACRRARTRTECRPDDAEHADGACRQTAHADGACRRRVPERKLPDRFGCLQRSAAQHSAVQRVSHTGCLMGWECVQVACCTLRVACCILRVACCMSYVARYMSHGVWCTLHWLHVVHCTLHAACNVALCEAQQRQLVGAHAKPPRGLRLHNRAAVPLVVDEAFARRQHFRAMFALRGTQCHTPAAAMHRRPERAAKSLRGVATLLR